MSTNLKESDVSAQSGEKRFTMTEYAQKFFHTTVTPSPQTKPRGMSITSFRETLRGKPQQPSSAGSTIVNQSEENTVDALVSYVGFPIKQPLNTSVTDDLAKKAVDIFANIMRYMGDYPMKKGMDQFRVMQKLSQRGIDSPKLRDEIFCQLIKQTTNNPRLYVLPILFSWNGVTHTHCTKHNSESSVSGWELLSICCGLFLPSRSFGPYLLDYLNQHAKQATKDASAEKKGVQDISRLAQVCSGSSVKPW